jgi:hypothetical protein
VEDLNIQIILRRVVGLQGVLAYWYFAKVIGQEYGKNAKRGFLLFCTVQYKVVTT